MKNMKELIEHAKDNAGATLQEKIARSKEPGVDVREVFTAEDFDMICQANEDFYGTIADIGKIQRHQRLIRSAKWLEANSLEVIAFGIEPVSRVHPNAIVYLDLRRLVSLRGRELREFTAMTALADTVFISALEGKAVRFTFGIERAWSEQDIRPRGQ